MADNASHEEAILDDKRGDRNEGQRHHLELVPSLASAAHGVETAAAGAHRHQGGSLGGGGRDVTLAILVLVVLVVGALGRVGGGGGIWFGRGW